MTQSSIGRLLALFGAMLALAACAGGAVPEGGEVQPSPTYPAPVDPYVPPTRGPVDPYHAPRPSTAPDQQLRDELYELWRTFPGKTGISVHRIDGGAWTLSFRGDQWFPQQSVSKLWVAMTVMDRVDHGQMALSDPVTVGFDDLAVFFSPTRDQVVANGRPLETTVGELLERALTHSDNTANDVLLWRAGGPEAVRAFLQRHDLDHIRFGPGERAMQSRIAGMDWKPEYSIGNAFFEARAKVPFERRQDALNAYLADPYDGARPDAITEALGRLVRRTLLSEKSTAFLVALLGKTKSGPNRLKAGVPAGWDFLHKTGTGQELGAIQTGYNDVGIMTAPDATRYAVAVMLADTTAGGMQRMEMMQEVARAVGRYHDRHSDTASR